MSLSGRKTMKQLRDVRISKLKRDVDSLERWYQLDSQLQREDNAATLSDWVS